MPSLLWVTRGIATYNRDTYLADAIRSSPLSQDFSDDGLEPGTGAQADLLAAVPVASPVGLL
jgi:hypothetical protein